MILLNDFYKIENFESTDNSFYYRIGLNAENTIYEAHFPGNPITPGVCIVQIASELLEKKLNRTLILSRANNIKFLSILSPIETQSVLFYFDKVVEINDICSVKVTVKDENQIFAKLSMSYSYKSIGVK